MKTNSQLDIGIESETCAKFFSAELSYSCTHTPAAAACAHVQNELLTRVKAHAKHKRAAAAATAGKGPDSIFVHLL